MTANFLFLTLALEVIFLTQALPVDQRSARDEVRVFPSSFVRNFNAPEFC
jgi:hypothetical protein